MNVTHNSSFCPPNSPLARLLCRQVSLHSKTISAPWTDRTLCLHFDTCENHAILTTSASLLLHLTLTTELCEDHLGMATGMCVGVVEAHGEIGMPVCLGNR